MKIWDIMPKRLGWREKKVLADLAARGSTGVASQAAGTSWLTLFGWAILGAAIVTSPSWISMLKAEYERGGAERIAERVLRAVQGAREADQSDTADRQALARKNAMGGYFVVKVTLANGGEIYSVRSGELFDDKGQPRRPIYLREFRHGGVGDARATLQVNGPHPSAAAATEYIGLGIAHGSIRKPPLAGGLVGLASNKTVTIDDWGLVDFGVLRRMGKFQ
jgi:hypothetical protein